VADAQAIKEGVLAKILTNPGGGGNYDHDYAAVPAGEIWMIQLIISSDLSSILSSATHKINRAATFYNVNYAASPGVAVYLKTLIPMVLAEDDYIRVTFSGVTGGDWLTSTIMGWSTPVY
jgi:hypothetical protein